jgi:hypothetical protein
VAERVAVPEVVWNFSQRTVWVASQGIDFLGIVEEREGTFVANDGVSGTYNTYSTLSEAMHALEERA